MYLLSTEQPTIRPDRCSIPESSLLFHRAVCLSLSPPVKNKQHECRVNRESRCGKEGGRGKKKGTGRWRKKEAADIHIYR